MISSDNVFDLAFEAGKSAFVFICPLADDLIPVTRQAVVKAAQDIRNHAMQKIADAIKRNEEELQDAEQRAIGPNQAAWMDMLNKISNGDWER